MNEKNKTINWSTIDDQMKNLKYPLSFLFNIILKQNKIDDYELSLIFRFFFKNQIDLVSENPIFIILKFLDKKFVISHKVFNDFYLSLIRKHIFIQILISFKLKYNNEKYWSQKFILQKEFLKSLLFRFKSFYNSSLTDLNGFTKFVAQLKINHPELNLIIKNSLLDSVKLIGIDFFKANDIRLISENDYNSLETKYKIKYITYFYIKVVKSLTYLINIYDLIAFYDNKLKEIINPKPIYFCFGNIYSENDTEDIDLLLEMN